MQLASARRLRRLAQGGVLALFAPFFIVPAIRAQNMSVRAPKNLDAARSSSPAARHLSEAYARLPLSFEPNRGQAPQAVQFVSRGKGYTLLLKGNEAVLGLQPSGRSEHRSRAAVDSALAMQLLGANAHASVQGTDVLPGKVNYFIGNDPSRWRSGIPTYAKVRYESVYPGVDLVYYGNQGQLEY